MMKKTNQEKDSKALTGALIGGIVGIGALTVFLALRRDKEEPLQTIGKTISHVSGILEEHEIEQPSPLKNFSSQLQKNEHTLEEVIDWVATGINLWKKFKN